MRVRLELEDRVVVEDVTPLQAAIVELFEGDGNETWTEAALMEKLGVDELALRGALAVWAAHGVLKDDGVAWRLLEVAEDPADRCKWRPYTVMESGGLTLSLQHSSWNPQQSRRQSPHRPSVSMKRAQRRASRSSL